MKIQTNQKVTLLVIALISILLASTVVFYLVNKHNEEVKYNNPSFQKYKQGFEYCSKFNGPTNATNADIYKDWQQNQPIGC